MFSALGTWQIFTISIFVYSSEQFYVADIFTLFYEETEAQNGEIICLWLLSQRGKNARIPIQIWLTPLPIPSLNIALPLPVKSQWKVSARC